MSLRYPPLSALTAWVLALAACSDPSVEVTFDIPAPYRPAVTDVSLQILVPPVAEPFTCDDLAFQQVSEIAIVASRAQEVRTRPRGSLALQGIPRLGPKLFFVQGLDQDGVAIVAACAEVGDIDEDTAVVLHGEPVVAVSSPAVAPGNPLPERVGVTVADTSGVLLQDIEVRWTIAAPGGALAPESAATDADGRVEIRTPADLLPGPVALDISARWQRSAPQSVIGFTEAPIMFQASLPGEQPQTTVGRTEALYQVGNIGPNGEAGFVGLGPPGSVTEGRQVYLAYRPRTPVDAAFHVAISDPLVNVHSIGLAKGDQRDRVVAINGLQLIDISPIDGSTTATLLTPTPGSLATRILPAGACGDAQAGSDVLLVSFADDTVAAYRADDGGRVSDHPLALNPPTPHPIASGCVHDIGKALRRTVVYASEGFQQSIVSVDDQGGVARGQWATYPAGIGFLPAYRDSELSLLLGASVSIEGTAIGRYQLVIVDQSQLDLELTTQDDSATLFWSTQGGDVDGDRLPDVVALLDFGAIDELTEIRLLVSLGIEHRGQRLVGISAPSAVPSPRLFLYDFDYDGHEDILVATPVSATIFQSGPGRSP